jgi:hypothetical protein
MVLRRCGDASEERLAPAVLVSSLTGGIAGHRRVFPNIALALAMFAAGRANGVSGVSIRSLIPSRSRSTARAGVRGVLRVAFAGQLAATALGGTDRGAASSQDVLLIGGVGSAWSA